MKNQYDLSRLDWKLSGWIPELWRMERSMEVGASPNAEVPNVSAKVPGSVQCSLREAGIIPDWNVGLNFRECEWVENRHWIYEAAIPDDWICQDRTHRLRCLGLDYSGEVIVNGELVSEFIGSHVPHVFDLTPHLQEKGNLLRIVFTTPPRWLGQFGCTSKMKEWKPRFNYTWDWTVRLVQIGIWDSISLEVGDGLEIRDFSVTTDVRESTGAVRMKASVPEGLSASIELAREGSIVREETVSASRMADGVCWEGLPVEMWHPNGHGDQPLYDLTCRLLDAGGSEIDRIGRRIGFKRVEWLPCEGAPDNADPWICEVNGKPVFLQGVNWTPILPNFADATEDDYRKRLTLYRDLGTNILRVWGGAFLEKGWFYDLCDELGLMVWQEFPLSSSGVDNYPPDDEKSIEEMAAIAESFIARRQHHASLLLWSGGNELINFDNHTPCDASHPMLARFKEIVQRDDPGRRFVPTSASGPTEWASAENFGKDIHWDVHGPWKAEGDLEKWAKYWAGDDALLRSETGSPGTSAAEMIRKYAGDLDPMPATHENPIWRRTSVWWIEWGQFVAEHGHELSDLEEYVAWSQARQAEALSIAVKACKDRFPRCGGIILWMGHDCFPCTANTSIIDFEGDPKPAALAVGEIFRLSARRSR